MADEIQTITTEEEVKVKPAKPAKAAKAESAAYWSVGRRKAAIARVRLVLGKGDILVNDKPLEEFAIHAVQKAKIMAPLAVTERQDAFDITVKVVGGGSVSQLDAISLGIARALLEYDAELRQTLKQAKLLTRDSRVKERKKYGLKRARKAPQFSKR